jgi:hypothetical protein
MNRSTLILVLFIIYHPWAILKAQQNEINQTIVQQLIGKSYTDPGFANKGIYFKESFLPGKITLISNDTVVNLKLKYNYSADELIWLSEEYGQVQVDKAIINEFELKSNDSTFRFKQMNLPGENGNKKHFYQTCYSGKLQLIVQRRGLLYNNYISNGKHYSLYKPDNVYFLLIGDKFYTLRKVNYKSLSILFPEKKRLIRNRIKDLHLKAKNETDYRILMAQLEDILL